MVHIWHAFCGVGRTRTRGGEKINPGLHPLYPRDEFVSFATYMYMEWRGKPELNRYSSRDERFLKPPAGVASADKPTMFSSTSCSSSSCVRNSHSPAARVLRSCLGGLVLARFAGFRGASEGSLPRRPNRVALVLVQCFFRDPQRAFWGEPLSSSGKREMLSHAPERKKASEPSSVGGSQCHPDASRPPREPAAVSV